MKTKFTSKYIKTENLMEKGKTDHIWKLFRKILWTDYIIIKQNFIWKLNRKIKIIYELSTMKCIKQIIYD